MKPKSKSGKPLKEPDVTIFPCKDGYFSEAFLNRIRETHNPDTYVLAVVEDLINSVNEEDLHIGGEPTTEYLGMLSLYAVRRAAHQLPPDKTGGLIVKWLNESFDPFNMSDELIAKLKELIEVGFLR